MLIRALKTIYDGRMFKPGEELERREAEALRLIDLGVAEAVKDPAVTEKKKEIKKTETKNSAGKNKKNAESKR